LTNDVKDDVEVGGQQEKEKKEKKKKGVGWTASPLLLFIENVVICKRHVVSLGSHLSVHIQFVHIDTDKKVDTSHGYTSQVGLLPWSSPFSSQQLS
jgi:hypothetical protein